MNVPLYIIQIKQMVINLIYLGYICWVPTVDNTYRYMYTVDGVHCIHTNRCSISYLVMLCISHQGYGHNTNPSIGCCVTLYWYYIYEFVTSLDKSICDGCFALLIIACLIHKYCRLIQCFYKFNYSKIE